MARVARVVLVSDLERCWPNYLGSRLLAETWWRNNRITRNDGPLSVRGVHGARAARHCRCRRPARQPRASALLPPSGTGSTRMTAPTFDCAIVGAGPAGSATATHLARAGLNVALLDRAAFPRPKPCGDCISPGANRLLERLGVLDRVQSHAAALHGWRIHSPSGAGFEARFDRIANDAIFARAYAIDQVYLDALLLEGAATRARRGSAMRTCMPLRRSIASTAFTTGTRIMSNTRSAAVC